MISTAYDVILIDAGTGNLRSVQKALESLGARVRLVSRPEDLQTGARTILPGVGAFGDFMKGLRERGLEEAILSLVRGGSPLLGICVGMQALFETGEEMGTHAGLGLVPGKVVRFSGQPGLKVPHTGWNELLPQATSPMWTSIEPGAYAYFNHSYYCIPARAEDVLAVTQYGTEFASAVQHQNLYGVQFHPEKSQRVGQTILQNFLKYS